MMTAECTHISDRDIADALRTANWSNVPIGYKAIIEAAIGALSRNDSQRNDCEVCGGDCAAANPPVMNCPRDECARRGIDPDEICADGGVTVEMVVAKETDAGCGRSVIEPWQTPAPCGGRVGSQECPLIGESANDQGEVRAFKWFDHECHMEGCQSLAWKDRYEAAVKGRAEFRNAYKAERAKVALLEARLVAAKP